MSRTRPCTIYQLHSYSQIGAPDGRIALWDVCKAEGAAGRKQYILHYVLCILTKVMAKTVAVREETWERMKKLLEAGDAKSFDELIRKLIDQSLRVPRSMFGVDRNKKAQPTLRQHEETARDAH